MKEIIDKLKIRGVSVYSYIRFSSEAQRRNSSVYRQTKLSEDFCRKYKLNLSPTKFSDLGISGFTGKNIFAGELSKFKLAVENGKIRSDSILLVESLDRLSRMPTNYAMEWFLSLTNLGITIITLSDNNLLNTETFQTNKMQLFGVLMVQERAHEESVTKSKRVAEGWHKKRLKLKSGMTYNKPPGWIRIKYGKYELIDEHVEIIKRIYREYIYGGLGSFAIAKELTSEGIPSFKTGGDWNSSSVKKILNNRCVLGCFTPKAGDEIPDFYPEIIDIDTFNKVKKYAASRKITGRKRNDGVVKNLFTGLIFCGYCGETMRWMNKGDDYIVLACAKHIRNGKCKVNSTPYKKFEALALKSLIIASEKFKHLVDVPEIPDIPALEKKKLRLEKDQKMLSENLRDHGANPAILKALRQTGDDLAVIVRRINDAKKEVKKHKITDFVDELNTLYDLRVGNENRVKLRSEMQGLISRITIKNYGAKSKKYGILNVEFTNEIKTELRIDYKQYENIDQLDKMGDAWMQSLVGLNQKIKKE